MEKQKVKVWFTTKFVPAVNKLGSQRHLASLRDAFGTLIPLTIAGSLGLIMSGIIFGGNGSGYISLLGLICKAVNPHMEWAEISNYFWQDNGFNKAMLIGSNVFGQLNNITIGMTAMWFSFTFGYFLAITRNSKNQVIAGFVSLISFLATTMGEIDFFKGAEGLISALIFGIISTELFLWLTNVRALYIKLPDGVPPSVSKSFAVFLPFMITVACIASLNLIFVIPNVAFDANLQVTKAAFTSFTDTQFSVLVGGLVEDGAVMEKLGGTFTEHKSLIDQLQSIFSSYDGENLEQIWEQITNLYNNSDDKAVLSTMFAVLSGVNPSTITNLTANASIEFIDANGVHVLLAKYIQIQMSGVQFGLSAAIYQFFVSSLLVFATGDGSIGLALAYAFFISFLWFFGVHGSNVVNGAFLPIWSMIGTVNITLITELGYPAAAASGEMGVFSGALFDVFMNLGGSGATIMLILGTLIFSKRQETKKIAMYAAPSGVFQINEPVLFGYPIVLNPVYCVPFVLAPMTNVIIAWVCSPAVMGSSSLIGYAQVGVPWTTPFFIAAVIVYMSPKALIPVIIVCASTFVIYLPFIWIDNMLYFKKLKRTNIELYEKEKRFFEDSKYHYQVLTNNGFERKVEKAMIIIGNAESQNRFWDQKMPDGEKLEKRKKENIDIAKIKYEYALQIANEYKKIREINEILKNEKWEMQLKILNLKKELVEKMKTLKTTKNDKITISNLKTEYKEKIVKVKNEYKERIPKIKENNQKNKIEIAKKTQEMKMRLLKAKNIAKEKILEIKNR